MLNAWIVFVFVLLGAWAIISVFEERPWGVRELAGAIGGFIVRRMSSFEIRTLEGPGDTEEYEVRGVLCGRSIILDRFDCKCDAMERVQGYLENARGPQLRVKDVLSFPVKPEAKAPPGALSAEEPNDGE